MTQDTHDVAIALILTAIIIIAFTFQTGRFKRLEVKVDLILDRMHRELVARSRT